jgi:hypothetical protein
MPFTAQELANIANATLDFHLRGDVMSQSIQDKPLLRKLIEKQKNFPGGKEFITKRVKGAYTTTIQGFSHDDTVTYANPANIRQVQYPWREIHAGIQVTMTELKTGGITVEDSTTGKSTSTKSQAEKIQLADLLDDKIEDMTEGWSRGMNDMAWRDGTQDAKLVPGVFSIISDTPAVGVTGGLDRAVNSWWRNRAVLGTVSNSGTYANLPLIKVLQNEFRQLRRYGGKPDCFMAGSDFLDALESELRAKGNFTQDGWAKTGRIEASTDDVSFKKIMVEYDPTLDDLARAKFGYVMDSRRITLMPMVGEDRKTHTPARPPEKYVIYRAMTWTGGLIATQLNCHGVYSIA